MKLFPVMRAWSCVLIMGPLAAGTSVLSSATRTAVGSPESRASMEKEIRAQVREELAAAGIKGGMQLPEPKALVQQEVQNSHSSGLSMEMHKLQAAERLERQKVVKLKRANHKYQAHMKKINLALINERVVEGQESRQLAKTSQAAKAQARVIQKLQTEVNALQTKTAALRASVANMTKTASSAQHNLSMILVNEALLRKNLNRMELAAKVSANDSAHEMQRLRQQLTDAQDQSDTLQEKDVTAGQQLALLRTSMLQKSEQLTRQSSLAYQASERRMQQLQARSAAEAKEFASDMQSSTSQVKGLEMARDAALSLANRREQEMSALAVKNSQGSSMQAALEKQFDELRRTSKAHREAAQSELTSLQGKADEEGKMLSSLQNMVREKSAELEASKASVAELQKQVAHQTQENSAMKTKLMNALETTQELEQARMAAERAAAAQQKKAQDAAKQARDAASARETEIAKDQQELGMAQAAQVKAEAQAQEFSKQRAGIEQQLAEAFKAKAAAESKAQEEMHATMLTAAGKIRALEDQEDSLQAALAEAKKSFSSSSTVEAKLKDQALQAEAEANKAMRTAEDLKDQLSNAQKTGRSSSARAAFLESKVQGMAAERKSQSQQLRSAAKELSDSKDEAENLQHSLDAQTRRLETASKEDSELQGKLQALSGVGERVQTLQGQVAKLKSAEASKDAKIAALQQRSNTLEDLKDSYSKQIDQWSSEGKAWHAKVDGLQQELSEETSKLQVAEQKRDEAVRTAKDQTSHEDEYFEETTGLQQKNEALNADLTQANATEHNAETQIHVLHQKLEDIRDDEVREEKNSKAVMDDMKRELNGVQKGQAAAVSLNSRLRMEIAQVANVLTDDQRQKLGLPSAHRKAAR